jgi:hypothetical protein
MSTPYTKTKGEIMGLAWTAVMLVLALVSLSGWPLALIGDNCLLIQTSNAPCWFYPSQWHWSLDFVYVVLAFLCLVNYLLPRFWGRKKARDAIIGVLFLDSFMSVVRVLLNSDIDIAGGYILGVALYAAINDGNTPRIERIAPSNASSPRNTVSMCDWFGIVPFAASSAIAMDKSKLDPLFGNQAGDKETVTFLLGHVSRQFTNAARTRSRDSDSAVSGKPKSAYIGRPSAISASTVTSEPDKPCSAMA